MTKCESLRLSAAQLTYARDALHRLNGLLFGLAETKGRAGIDVLRSDFERLARVIGMLLPATSLHDAGAYARCSYCGRYSASAFALRADEVSDHFAPCDCGNGSRGWCGSFVPPGPDAQWSIGVHRVEEAGP